MSLRSSNSRRALHFDASLDDFEDLDYEPDGFDDSNIDEDLLIQHEQESVSNATSVPAPNHRSFDTSSDVSDRTMSISSINNFRSNMNYKSMHVGVGKDSFRNNYVSYMNSTGIQHLDSSDDESELQFSDSEPTEGLSVNTDTSETNLELENDSECDQQIGSSYVSPESPIDSLYAEENSYSDDSFLVSPTSIGGDNASSIDYSAKQPFGNETACSKLPLDNIKQQKPRIKASNFTITVKGNQRFCLQPEIMAPLPVAPISVPKLQRNRWYPWNLKLRRFMKNYPDIKCLRSTDDIIRFTKEESENPSVSRGSQFKIPLKRPPTRPKSSNLSVSVNSLSGVKVVNDVENIDDDIISLIGSTSISILEDGLIKSEAYSETSNLTPDPELTQMNRVAEWVDQTENLRPVIVDYKKIPTVYHGLCYNFFLTNQCTLRACKNSHSMTQGHHRKLAALANSYQFMEAYNFAKSEPNFFSKVFHVFAAIFGFRDNKDALIEIIEMILSACSADSRIEGVNTVLKHLQKCKSLSIFEDVIEYVRAKIDIKKYPILGEILIEIIISMENLSKNWPILRKMCNIGQRIPQKLAGKMLVNLMKYPVDHQVCREVWQHINDHKCLDLRLLPVSTKDSFLRICDPRVAVSGAMPAYQLEATIEQNLSRERDNFDRLKFSRPPPAFGQPALSQQASLRTVNSFNNNQIQPLPQALNFENLPDFASLSHQQVTFAGFELSESRPFTQLTAQPRFRQRSTSSTSSSTNINSDSDLFDQSTSQSSLINNRTGFMYNDEGLQYDPIKDYCPPNKRRKTDLSETCFYNSKPVSSDRSHSSSSLTTT